MKKPTYEELEGKVQFYEEVVTEARKQIMKALRENGLWNPEFHQQELVAITAIFLATKSELDKKDKAISIALEFINKFENDSYFGADEVLNKIKTITSNIK